MPELPEVETVRRGLSQWLPGKKLTEIETFHPRATHPKSLAPLGELRNAKVESINRRGKFLWFTLNRPFVLVAHLGMSGQFLIEKRDQPLSPHTRVRVVTNDRKRELRFVDQRTFGWLAIDEMSGITPKFVSHIAPDIMDPLCDDDAVIHTLRKRSTSIKSALLNQAIVSGVGNIYADESLWRAKIHPERRAGSLSPSQLGQLLSAVRGVMSDALAAGGTSFDDLYINVNGESGYFDVDLAAYGREGEPCPRCGAHIKRIAFANRSSHYCPRCQRKSSRHLSQKGAKSAKRSRRAR